MGADKAAAADAARRLMREEGISAAAASRRVAADYPYSAETIRRAVLGADYSNTERRTSIARIEQLEMRVAGLEATVARLLGEDLAVIRARRAVQSGAGYRKLNPQIVREIRSLYEDDGVPVAELASRYGIKPGTIYMALSRRTWAHVD